MNRYQLTQCIEKGCKNIWAKIKLQGHNDSVVILRNKTTFFVLKTSFNSSTSFVVISSKCVTAENFHTPSTEGIGNSWCQRFFRKGGGGGELLKRINSMGRIVHIFRNYTMDLPTA